MRGYEHTTEVTTIQKFRLDIFPVMFLCLPLDNFEHAG